MIYTDQAFPQIVYRLYKSFLIKKYKFKTNNNYNFILYYYIGVIYMSVSGIR